MDSIDNRKRICDEEGIISTLPDHLINPILERLPIQEAVRTSILSRNWRFGWTTMSSLIFDRHFSEKFSRHGAFDRNGFTRIINNIMLNHSGPILKFHLYIPHVFLDSFQEIDQWMRVLSRNGVTELILENSNRVYRLPSAVFFCKELKSLVASYCFFKPPIGFVGFSCLQNIVLVYMSFGAASAGSVMNLPELRKLTLDRCTDVQNFTIEAKKLQTLWVGGCPDAMYLRLMLGQSLYVVHICLWRPVEDLLQVERFSLSMMLSKLPNVVSLTFDGYFLKFLVAERYPQWLVHELKCLKHLEIQSISFGDLDHLEAALCILWNSPGLNVFRVSLMQMGPDADLELTSKYLESPNCLSKKLLKLRVVQITSFEGTRPELLLVKLLLDRSPHLEKMVIRPKATIDAETSLKIAMDLMVFPRASTKAEMFYLARQP